MSISFHPVLFLVLLFAGSISAADIGVISPADAQALLETKDSSKLPVVLDTRGGYKDYFRAHLPRAHHLNFDTLRGTDDGVPVQYLPDDLTYPLLWVGLLINIQGTFVPLDQAVIGAVAGYMSLWSVNALFKLYKKVDGMGGGDFKLLAALGAWFGWKMLLPIILLSSGVGAVVGIAMIMMGPNSRETKIPFGPYLVAAGMLALLFGPELQTMMTNYLQPA